MRGQKITTILYLNAKDIVEYHKRKYYQCIADICATIFYLSSEEISNKFSRTSNAHLTVIINSHFQKRGGALQS
jgi:hypothetical protein